MYFRHIATTSLSFLTIFSFAICEARTKFTYEGAPISYQQVYANPENTDLQLNYARQQAAAGDYLSAAGALEAMLFNQPNWDSARLFYAILIYELDDRLGARREFEILKIRNVSEHQKNLINYYLGELDKAGA